MIRLMCAVAVAAALCGCGSHNNSTAANRNDRSGTGANSATATTDTRAADNTTAKMKASDAVNAVLSEANAARTEISNKDKDAAARDVQDALNRVNAIAGTTNARMVPVYTELGEYTVLGPVTSNGTASHTQTGSADRVAPNASAKRNNNGADVGVNRVVGEYTAITLDVQTAKTHLQNAKDALARGDNVTADRELGAVQGAVIVASVAGDMPLLRARQNLILARNAADHGDYAQARAALQDASQALANYQAVSQNHKQDAAQLKSEIDSYNQSIDQNHGDATSKINGWWERVTDWATPAGATTTTASNTTKRPGTR